MASQEIPVHTLLQDDYKDVIIFFFSQICVILMIRRVRGRLETGRLQRTACPAIV